MNDLVLEQLRARNRLDAGVPFLGVVRGDELLLTAPLEPSPADREHAACESVDRDWWQLEEEG